MKPHIYHPHAGDVVEPVAGDQAEPVAGAIVPNLAGPGSPNPNDPSAMRLMIAREEALVWKNHLAVLIGLWDALGVYGFVCKDTAKLPEFLAKVNDLRSILKG